MSDWYPMDFEAWDEGTVDLSLEEEGAYLRICNQIYRRGQPIPNSEKLLCSIWRCHQNKARVLIRRLIEAGKIAVLEDGRLANGRATQELDKRETLRRRRADAGHTGGIRSGDVRRKSLKNKDPDEAKRSTGQDRTVHYSSVSKETGADAPVDMFDQPAVRPEARLFKRGREVLGQSAGGMITDLLKAKGNVQSALAAIEEAAGCGVPKQFIGKIIRMARARTLDDEEMGVRPI